MSTARHVARWILLVVAALLLAAALVSLINTNFGAVRMLDVLREPLIYLAVVLAVISLFLAGKQRMLFLSLLLASAVIHFYRVWPYWGGAPVEMELAGTPGGAECPRVLWLNVKQSNDQYDRVAGLIAREQPDVVLLMETNQTWIDRLEPTLSSYSYRLDRPLDNTYGMAFATRLAVDSAQTVQNTSANTPTLYATLRMPDGALLALIGLHPRPPLPGESTQSRDRNIARAGARTPDNVANVLAIGDFNDVPWSRTTQNFVETGGYLDPRVGRGTHPTFPSDWLVLGWPLDQIFVKPGLEVATLRVLEDVGSDHRPVVATVCAAPAI